MLMNGYRIDNVAPAFCVIDLQAKLVKIAVTPFIIAHFYYQQGIEYAWNATSWYCCRFAVTLWHDLR